MPGLLSQGRLNYNRVHKISPNDSVSQLGYYMTSSSSETNQTSASCVSSHTPTSSSSFNQRRKTLAPIKNPIKRIHHSQANSKQQQQQHHHRKRITSSVVSSEPNSDSKCLFLDATSPISSHLQQLDHGGTPSTLTRKSPRDFKSGQDFDFGELELAQLRRRLNQGASLSRQSDGRHFERRLHHRIDLERGRKDSRHQPATVFDKISTCTDQSSLEFHYLNQYPINAIGLSEPNPRLAPKYYDYNFGESLRILRLDGAESRKSNQGNNIGHDSSPDREHGLKGASNNNGPPPNMSRCKRRNVGARRMHAWNDETYYLDPYALSELFSQSEIPGFREIFASDSYLRKFCWILAFLVMTVLSLHDVTELITEYAERPITVGLRLRDEPRLPFPSVTVCNLNIVRYSAICDSNSKFRGLNWTNIIPSELRDRLCNIQIVNKDKSGSDSDISDINNIRISTTTTSTTTSSTTTPIPSSTTQASFSTPAPSNLSSNVEPSTTGHSTDIKDHAPTSRPNQAGVATSTSNGPIPSTITVKQAAQTTVPGTFGEGAPTTGDNNKANGALDLGDFSPRSAHIPMGLLASKRDKLAHKSAILRGPFSSRDVKVNIGGQHHQTNNRRKLSQMLINSHQRGNISAGSERRVNPSAPGSALSRSPPQNERQGPRILVSPGGTASPGSPGGNFNMSSSAPSNRSTMQTPPNAGGGGMGPTYNVMLTPSASEDFGYNERIDRELQENLTNWLAVMYQQDPHFTLSLGHQFEDMILRCTMKYNNCTHERNFVDTFSPNEGNCFTYKSKMRNVNNNRNGVVFDEVNLAGANQGLELVLNLEKNEYISGSSQVGALVMVHHPGDSGYAASEATFITPEFTTYIGIKMVNITRLPAPYPEKCVNTWPSQFADKTTRDRTYSQQACLKTCLQKTILNHCQCQSATLPILEPEYSTTATTAPSEEATSPSSQQQASDASSSPLLINADSNAAAQPVDSAQPTRVKICDTRKQAVRQCVSDVKLRAAERVHKCDCAPKCQVVRYDKTVSMAKWPTREDRVTFDRSKVNFDFKNLAKVIVYFQTMTCDEITQQAVHTPAKLISSLGGIMGMYVGFSFLSVFEIFEVISRKTWHHYRMKLSNKQS